MLHMLDRLFDFYFGFLNFDVGGVEFPVGLSVSANCFEKRKHDAKSFIILSEVKFASVVFGYLKGTSQISCYFFVDFLIKLFIK